MQLAVTIFIDGFIRAAALDDRPQINTVTVFSQTTGTNTRGRQIIVDTVSGIAIVELFAGRIIEHEKAQIGDLRTRNHNSKLLVTRVTGD